MRVRGSKDALVEKIWTGGDRFIFRNLEDSGLTTKQLQSKTHDLEMGLPRTPPDVSIGRKPQRPGWALRYADAGMLSYVSGLVGAASFMALAIGPGWVGFFAVYIPVSLLSAWAASHS